MMWGTANPTKTGWYLVTVEDFVTRWVMPLYRDEYPKGIWSWKGLSGGLKVIASQKFPSPYKERKL